jgi:activator of HSP90 ATPase
MEFTLEIILPATPKQIYESWLDSDLHSEMTGAEALITDEEGDPFNAWDGYIWGKNLKLETNKYIKQTWKTSDFEEDQDFSIIEITLSEIPEGTLLKLHHSNLLDSDDHYKKGWEDYYFQPMKDYFQNP